MANCKICGRSVMAGVVMHTDCIERQVNEAMKRFCTGYCQQKIKCSGTKDSLGEICRDCPIGQRIKLAKQMGVQEDAQIF